MKVGDSYSTLFFALHCIALLCVDLICIDLIFYASLLFFSYILTNAFIRHTSPISFSDIWYYYDIVESLIEANIALQGWFLTSIVSTDLDILTLLTFPSLIRSHLPSSLSVDSSTFPFSAITDVPDDRLGNVHYLEVVRYPVPTLLPPSLMARTGGVWKWRQMLLSQKAMSLFKILMRGTYTYKYIYFIGVWVEDLS